MKILDKTNNEVPRMTVIARYFKREGEGVSEFSAGCKALTDADKDELAAGAAKELGFTVVN